MANIGASDVTYTINDKKRWGTRYLTHATIAFGNATLTYPSGGIPLTKSKMEVTNLVSVEIFESNGKGLIYEWNRSANTIRIFNPTQETNSNTNRAGVEYVTATTAPAATSLEVVIIGF